MVKMNLTPEQIKRYLDNNISHWRRVLFIAKPATHGHVIEQASDYIDAYQSVRLAIFGEVKPLEEWQVSIEE